MEISDFFTAIPAFLALGTSIWSIFLSKRSLISQNVSIRRFEWITEVRGIITEFISEYVENGNQNQKKLVKIYSRLMLYLNPAHAVYAPLVNSLKACLSSDNQPETVYANCIEVLNGAQKALNTTWKRAKVETGIRVNERKIIRAVEESSFNSSADKWDMDWMKKK